MDLDLSTGLRSQVCPRCGSTPSHIDNKQWSHCSNILLCGWRWKPATYFGNVGFLRESFPDNIINIPAINVEDIVMKEWEVSSVAYNM